LFLDSCSAPSWPQTTATPAGRVPVIITYDVTDGIQRTWQETHYYRSDRSVAHTMPSPGDSAPPQLSVVVEGQPNRWDCRIPRAETTVTPVNRPKTVHETYLAPDLNFVPLFRHVNNGERVTHRQIAISVDRKEPDDTVFAIPAD
jgi:hypothetical protein